VKFLVDEDVTVDVVRCLQQQGHETQLVFEALGPRSTDERVWEHAVRTNAIVVTCNRDDFLKLAGTAPETGLIIVKRRRTRQAECRKLLDLLKSAGESGLRNNINFA
jgi:predicted nuclease of predicted toxin-antitoxin system